jgi:SAM-dependent methyltransferase
MESTPLRPHQTLRLRESMARRLHRRSVASGEIALPAVPGMLDEYVKMCDSIFAALGTPFTAEERAHLAAAIEEQLAEAFSASPRSSIVISYDAPVGTVLNYHISARWSSLEQAYENWVGTRQPPFFGTEPDARVWALACDATDPATHRVLDVGAGTGRNALALARRGHPVDAVEMTPKFADLLRVQADEELLDVCVIQRDVFETLSGLRRDYRLIVLSEVVSDFRDTRYLRAVFELATVCLLPGGRLVFNAFLTRDEYSPDSAARELGQQVYTSFFTPAEMSAATEGLPIELVDDQSVYEYEQAHLPRGAWPPTSWYAEWVSGQDLFDVSREDSPVQMRWLVYERT